MSETRGVSPPAPKRQKVESTITKSKVANFFAPVSKKEPERLSWHVVHDTLLFARYKPPISNDTSQSKRNKIAAFDLDSTLIKTSSGHVFSKDAADWQWWHPKVPGELNSLYSQGYHICVLTNQGRLNLRGDSKTVKGDHKALSIFKNKVNAVLNNFDFPVLLLAATGRDTFRKPRSGMWSEVLEEINLGVSDDLDLPRCFFVGDAGGRAARGSSKADHSCSDRDMASNVGIDFRTPEEYFLNEEATPFLRRFEPQVILDSIAKTPTDILPTLFEKKHDLDLTIMCGSPASGKSTFYWNKLRPLGYERVNQDTLKSRDKCVKVATAFISEGKSVAVDNTNADPATRAVWTQLAQDKKIPIRCVYFTASPKLCEHNDTVRALAQDNLLNPEERAILPHSAFAGFASRFKEPKLKEGFEDIVRVEFKFEFDEARRRVWGKYWI